MCVRFFLPLCCRWKCFLPGNGCGFSLSCRCSSVSDAGHRVSLTQGSATYRRKPISITGITASLCCFSLWLINQSGVIAAVVLLWGKQQPSRRKLDSSRKTADKYSSLNVYVDCLLLLPCCFLLEEAAEISDASRRRRTSARAAFITVNSSSCCWTRSSRAARRSLTSETLAPDMLSSVTRRTEM